MRVQDVTPEYVRAIQSLGLKPSSTSDRMKGADCHAPGIHQGAAIGGIQVSINDIISAKVQDGHARVHRTRQAARFKDLTLQKLISTSAVGNSGFEGRYLNVGYVCVRAM